MAKVRDIQTEENQEEDIHIVELLDMDRMQRLLDAFSKMTEGTPLGTLLEHLHELNVHFRGFEEHI